MKIATIEKIMKLSQQTEEGLTDAFSLLLGVEDRKSVDQYMRWVRGRGEENSLYRHVCAYPQNILLRSAVQFRRFYDCHGVEP